MISPTKTAANARAEAVNTAGDASAAVEASRMADTAFLLSRIEESFRAQNESNLKYLKQSVIDVVNDALGTHPTRYFDARQIPLICKSIFEMHLQLKLILWILGITGSTFIVGLIGKFLNIL